MDTLVVEFPLEYAGLDRTIDALREEAAEQLPELLFELGAAWASDPVWRVGPSERAEDAAEGLSLFAEGPGEPWQDPVRYRGRDWVNA
ncbi:hypothetical protein RDI86_01380 [Cellulosimicrobium sp. XJ-DQ-B-000]|uniref:hypothetical protein n=1 Tax=Cellulosimicrobium sp. XJ-DQ-B-000 TaxID=3072182 RepID=UPI00280843E1|nr:hypothetical protein [Cellulosimicrobium sp. XJ-DQ-B-000]MDQ8040500.1 hypothetical protein [Cellulosimicrobium sp. XJ-DQ-B-000]